MGSVLKVILASYRHSTYRSLIVILALVTANLGLSAVLILNEAAKDSFNKVSQPLVQNVSARILSRGNSPITKPDYASLRRAGFQQLLPATIKRLSVVLDDKDIQFMTLYGIDSFALLNLPTTILDEERQQADDLYLLWQPEGNLFIHQSYAKELGIHQGQRISTEKGLQLPPFQFVSGSTFGRQIVSDISLVQRLYDTENISEIWFVGEISSQQEQHLRATLPAHLKLELQLQEQDTEQLTRSFHLNILAMALLMFAVCMFVVMNALNLLLAQRLENLKILRQLGVGRFVLFSVLLIELLALSLITAPLGFVLGNFTAQQLSPAVSSTLGSLYGASLGFEVPSNARVLLWCVMASVIGAAFAALLPLWDLNKKLSHRLPVSSRPAHPITSIWLYLAVLLLVAASILFLTTYGLNSSFLIIGLLLLSGCCAILWLIPPLLQLIYQTLPQSRYLLRYGVARGLQISHASKVAFCAFFIAIAANIGMNLMVDSFREATHSWLQQRLNAQAYLFTESPEKLQQWHNESGAEGSLVPRMEGSAEFNELEDLSVRFRPKGERYQHAIALEQSLKDVWLRFENNEAILVNQQLFISQKLRLGDSVSVTLKDQNTLSLVVAGVFLDYGNPDKQALLPEKLYPKSSGLPKVFALYDLTKEELKVYENRLNAADFEASLLNTQALLTLSMDTFDTTFVITDSLNFVTLLVAIFSLVSSMLIINLDDKPKHALMRSLGFSRRALLVNSLLQYSGLSLLIGMLAIPFGLGLSWLLINLVNVQAFYWRYPLLVDSGAIVWVITLSVLLVIMTLLLPLFKAHNRPLSEDIKWLS